ncbi:hypothetical protein [Methylobacterium sp.]|uniref:hypothetical protein n=1 Tax=Methylobacterium sp. TaxID=409 RepID=UPI0025D8BE1B|nr:hypothetical protein [Methylobacterium sp.]MBY0259124.1 hypothetical protein [Methylobacterium sp.]
MSLADLLDAPRTFVRVYELPERLTDGYCFGGGKPILFLNVDWFEAIVSDGAERLTSFIKSKQYYRPHARFLVLGDAPGFTFVIEPEGSTGSVQ